MSLELKLDTFLKGISVDVVESVSKLFCSVIFPLFWHVSICFFTYWNCSFSRTHACIFLPLKQFKIFSLCGKLLLFLDPKEILSSFHFTADYSATITCQIYVVALDFTGSLFNLSGKSANGLIFFFYYSSSQDLHSYFPLFVFACILWHLLTCRKDNIFP